MINLGKIALLLFLIPHALYSAVTASVSSTVVTLGDSVTLNLKVSGEDVKRPELFSICDSDVTSTGSQTSIHMINGNYQKAYTLSYQFTPQKSCVIEPIEVETNGIKEQTKAINIEVKPMDVAKDSSFILSLQSSKKEVYVGEPFEVVLLFKQKGDSRAVDSKFIPPELKGLWVKEEKETEKYREGDYSVSKVTYLVSAQREGEQKVVPAQMKIAYRDSSRDSWGAWIAQIKWKTYFSNELSVNVKALPAGVDIVGDFTIEAIADKNEINANEAANITVVVKGEGNLEDIKTFKPFMDGVSIFDEKSLIKDFRLTQKMAFVSDKDFTIAPFTLKFFNPKTKEIKTVQTKEINIKVHGSKVQEELTIKREEETPVQVVQSVKSGIDLSFAVALFVLGTLFGAAVVFYKPWKLFTKEKENSIKDPKVLLVKLLPFKDDKRVQEIVDMLEKNLYSAQKAEIDKKALKEILKIYNIS